MAKTTPKPTRASGSGGAAGEVRPGGGPTSKPPAESIKETVDSIIIALSLALVFRAFVVEAFVIPTGSMAGTLLGKHRHFVCADCGYRFDVGVKDGTSSDRQLQKTSIYCPVCGGRIEKDSQLLARRNPDRGGDKILVFKFPYLFAEPKRWDVVVFYNPAKPEDNFIKRLIGKPGEFIQIVDGDIYVGKDSEHLKIERKPALVQRALWRPAYLNDYLPKRRGRRGADPSVPMWVPDPGQQTPSGWTSDSRKFLFAPKSPAGTRDRLVFKPDALQLGFHDYFSYNGYPASRSLLNVVWDLKLQFVVFFKEPGGAVSMSMNRRDDRFTATIHQDGGVELFKERPNEPRHKVGREQLAPFPLDRGVLVALQNVDFCASVWVEGRPELVTTEKDYHPTLSDLRLLDEMRAEAHRRPEGPSEESARVPEVWIEAYGKSPTLQSHGDGARLEVWHVSLYRDVYYTSRIATDTQGKTRAIDRGSPASEDPRERIIELRDYPGRSGDDEFFVMGDNSPSSSDGRVWGAGPDSISWHLKRRLAQGHYRAGRVPRDHLIGRAFFVYWPAGLRIFDSSVQLVPNVGRMRLIH